MERSTMLVVGMPTISMVMFNSYVANYQRASLEVDGSYYKWPTEAYSHSNINGPVDLKS